MSFISCKWVVASGHSPSCITTKNQAYDADSILKWSHNWTEKICYTYLKTMTAVWAQFQWQTTFILPRKIIFIYSWSNGRQLRNWWLWCASGLVPFHYMVHINILNPKAVNETGECTEINIDINKAKTTYDFRYIEIWGLLQHLNQKYMK